MAYSGLNKLKIERYFCFLRSLVCHIVPVIIDHRQTAILFIQFVMWKLLISTFLFLCLHETQSQNATNDGKSYIIMY